MADELLFLNQDLFQMGLIQRLLQYTNSVQKVYNVCFVIMKKSLQNCFLKGLFLDFRIFQFKSLSGPCRNHVIIGVLAAVLRQNGVRSASE